MLQRCDWSAWRPEHNAGVTAEADHLRRVPYLVASAWEFLHALDIHPDLGRSPFDHGQWTGKAYERGIEAIEIAPDLLFLVASRVGGDEDELDLISIRWCQALQGKRHIGEHGDTDIGAVRIAEEEQCDGLGRRCGEVVWPTGRVGQGDLGH